ncbi:hypothetical protein GP486_003862 [Trichoglossum hirsutum]|uniref:Uncharacterized protein n=1 Tax=Trichoglossum hirsutum TaxID=265104 RepID=A0A9P8LC94_9PEZI|nr:hypothetical protein GP486_003862 [Trichoglossum hirsutum]
MCIVDEAAVTTFRLTRAEEAKILVVEPSQLQPIEEEFVSDFPTSPVAALCGAFRRLDNAYFENSLYGRTLIRVHTPKSPFSDECPAFVSELFCDSTYHNEAEGPHMVFVINDRLPQKRSLTVWVAADDLGAGSPASTLRLLFKGLAQARHGMRHFCSIPLREWKASEGG